MDRNRLGDETSPYLLQHRDNPVHWQPWDQTALAAARTADKPILLSVGYAACHWCHVMAHESFENPEIAATMNRLFINIKVDREERPDLDQIYQHALALMGEQGGWPLTMFLTPDGEPFWGGTYFPPEQRWGRPGFPQVLEAISEAYARKRDEVAKNVAVLREALQRLGQPQQGGAILRQQLDPIAERLLREVDQIHGGIGTAPKFPQCGILELLWRAWKRTASTPYRDAVDEGARRDVPGRHLRPSRRRLRSLFDRCALAGAAFRKDALRQCRAGRSADPGLAGDQEPALPAADRRNPRLGHSRDAHAGGRLRQQPRRRQRARGRQVLRLVRGRNRCGARATTRRCSSASTM